MARPRTTFLTIAAAAAASGLAAAGAGGGALAHPGGHEAGGTGVPPVTERHAHTGQRPVPQGEDPDGAQPADHAHEPADLPASPPPPRVEITIGADGYRHITANGVPNHATGPFPGRGNPNAIRAQRYDFRVTLTPAANESPTPSAGGPFGIALNGVVFDPFTAGFYNNDPQSGWREAADPHDHPLGIDSSAAHVQPNGAYHYHGIPAPLIDADDAMTLVGWAADGFPIYGPLAYKDAADATSPLVRLRSSYRVKKGERAGADGKSAPAGEYDGTYEEDHEYVAGLGDLDACNGRYGVTPEFPEGTYYYVVTDDYPWVPRLFRGTPDPSFALRRHERRNRGPGANRPPRRPRRPPGARPSGARPPR